MDSTTDLTIPVTAADHVQGPEDAPVTLVEFGDYECPHCGRAYPVVKAVQKKMGNRLRFAFRNFPLSQAHPHAELAAEAAEAAGAQGKFWEMHDAIYENQESLGERMILDLARNLGLDIPAFTKDLESRKFKEHVKKDFMGGVRSGVNGTPAFFINGYRYDGSWDPESLLEVLQDAANNPE